jgi:two-component system chemotaxis sensor kinase CheA
MASDDDEDFLLKLRAAFAVEAEEHLQAIAAGLLAVEKQRDDGGDDDDDRRRETIATVFREAHSLKGAARAVNASDVEAICQSLEGVLAAWKREDVRPTAEQLDPLHGALRALQKVMAGAADSDGHADHSAATLGTAELNALLDQLAAAAAAATKSEAATRAAPTTTHAAPASVEHRLEPQPPPAGGGNADRAAAGKRVAASRTTPAPAETRRISTAKLDALLLEAQEMLAVKLMAAQRCTELRELLTEVRRHEAESARAETDVRTLRRSLEGDGTGLTTAAAPAAAARLLDLLESNETCLKALAERVGALTRSAEQDHRTVGGMIHALLEDSKKLLMLPCATLFEGFPKLVRDLSRDEGKEVELEVHGGEIEIDKRVLEEMKDPLIHVLRNCVDHGIEPPQERVRRGKPPRGTITVAASQPDGSKVEIRIGDDGAGIDAGAVRDAAVRHGVLSADDAARLGEREALGLIFRADVSTSPLLTEISGRGVGLAVVKEKVEKLGGRVVLDTRLGQGTSLRLLLPLTLATFRGILLRCADQTFVLPTAAVERVGRLRPGADIITVENREAIRLDGRTVSLVRLQDVLGMSRGAAAAIAEGYVPFVVLGGGDGRVAFIVDGLLGEQDVLVKPLARPLVRVRNVAAATVLGDGKAVPVLNPTDLLKSAARLAAPAAIAAPPVAAPATAVAPASPAPAPKSVLVVEDSITARMLLKNILESAGYAVKTAVDGVDALTLVRTEPFDLVVSDVEMPRMNGFDLTARIRADKKLADLPVVLVTALASPEDRERGVEAGADAYLVKSSFDQTNLLDVVQRLL